MRRLRAFAASLGETCFERIWSQISRFRARSSEPAGKFSEVALSTVEERCKGRGEKRCECEKNTADVAFRAYMLSPPMVIVTERVEDGVFTDELVDGRGTPEPRHV